MESESLKIEDYKEDYLKIRSILIPELTATDFNCSLGIWGSETNRLAKSAYDMQQIIRYAQAWYIYPEGGIGVDFLLLECLEIYGCLFECKIEEIFKHYTNEREVVQYAKDIEAYVKMIETGITKAQPYVITIEKLTTKIEQLLKK